MTFIRKRTGSSNIAFRRSVLKLGNRSRSTVLMLVKLAETEPIAAKLDRQIACPVVFQHAARFGGNDFRLLQIPVRRPGQQFVIRHARPKEIAQPACEFIVRQGLDVLRPVASGSGFRAGDRVLTGTIRAAPCLLCARAVRKPPELPIRSTR